ncbi:MAG: phosphate ABC transporter substrate-binding protein PstS family protein [Nitrospinaceae bacterium]|nr:MAG: phosphate ABC transporter substrate-binding protein PstS family protein [Nitrospinaceae bacterium]
MKTRKLLSAGGAALIALMVWAPQGLAQTIQVDPALSSYGKVGGVSGNLSSVGSDTLNNLMTFWTEKFKEYYPNVNIQVEGKGSSTAPPALISATAQLGPMSRAMKGKEVDEFEKKFGYKPTPVRVAVDALAIFVNKDNPIKGLSLAQVDAAFSKSARRGHKPVATWGQLGLTGDWATRPISLYGRNSASGTYGFFKKLVLKKGDYRDEVKEQPGSASVVQSVSVDNFGMGYSGIGYKTSSVRALPLSEKGTSYVEATAANALTGDYPLARFLYIYVNKAPGKPLDPLTQEFLKLVLSNEGQEVVVKGGYFPIAHSVVNEELAAIGGTPMTH